MAEIKKIKVNGAEYDVQPEWASVNEGGLPTIGRGSTPFIRFGTYTDAAEGYDRTQIEIIADDIVLGYSASCRQLFGEGDDCVLSFFHTQIGFPGATVKLYGTVLVNDAPIDSGAGVNWATDDFVQVTIGGNREKVLLGTGNSTLVLGTGYSSRPTQALSIGSSFMQLKEPGGNAMMELRDNSLNLTGTVLVNGTPIAGAGWADYDQYEDVLLLRDEILIGTYNFEDATVPGIQIPKNCGTIHIGYTHSGVSIDAPLSGPLLNNGIELAGDLQVPFGEINVGTTTGDYLVSVFDGQMTLTRQAAPYYCIWLGTNDGKISVGDPDDGMDGARVLIGTDSISMGTTDKTLTIGTDSISMGTGGMTIGTRALSLGSAAVTAGDVTLDWSGLNGVKLSYDATAGTVTLSAGGKSATIQLS